MKKKDTIFALSSSPGKSAVSLVRISGELAIKLIDKSSSNMPKKANQASLNKIITSSGEIIDQTITTVYKKPRSFTGEDMVEISFHGSNAVIKKFFTELSRNKNLRMAQPGEFTRRAFENNKLDLTQVEAIADIVNAETEMQRKQAVNHLSGKFFKSSKDIFEGLKNILANTEAIIDFSEEDLPENLLEEIKEQIENKIRSISNILEGSSIGIGIRDGFLITILGKPNAGKSSFINYVSDRDLSIVTDQPGTTRDLIESFIDIDGYPIKLVDTAGIRDSVDKVEKIGVQKAIITSNEAYINLIFINNAEDIHEFTNIKNPIFIKSKYDIFGNDSESSLYYNISSKTGHGIKDLLNLIKEKIQDKTQNEKSYISRERHINCLNSVKNHLKSSKEEKSIDLFAEDIRLAINKLSELFGNVDIEDILDIIFSDFCIGK